MNAILRQKIRRAAASSIGVAKDHGAEPAWRLALPRALQSGLGLMADVSDLRSQRLSLTEVLDQPPDRALILLLDGPDDALGMMAISPGLTAALIEQQTTGRVLAQDPPLRRPTRIDAAMAAGSIDRALAELELLLAEEDDIVWAGGFRTGSHVEDPRLLGLLLEEQPYRMLTTDLSLGGGGRQGQALLILPADGRGKPPQGRAIPGRAGTATANTARAAPAGQEFGAALAASVMSADCRLDAVISRLSLPLMQVMSLSEGQLLALPGAKLDQIRIEGMDGRLLAQGRLGQHRGHRALRLKELGAGEEPPPKETAVALQLPEVDLPVDFPSTDFRAVG